MAIKVDCVRRPLASAVSLVCIPLELSLELFLYLALLPKRGPEHFYLSPHPFLSWSLFLNELVRHEVITEIKDNIYKNLFPVSSGVT